MKIFLTGGAGFLGYDFVREHHSTKRRVAEFLKMFDEELTLHKEKIIRGD